MFPWFFHCQITLGTPEVPCAPEIIHWHNWFSDSLRWIIIIHLHISPKLKLGYYLCYSLYNLRFKKMISQKSSFVILPQSGTAVPLLTNQRICLNALLWCFHQGLPVTRVRICHLSSCLQLLQCGKRQLDILLLCDLVYFMCLSETFVTIQIQEQTVLMNRMEMEHISSHSLTD